MSSPNTGKYGPEIITYLDTSHAMKVIGVTGNILCYFYLNVWFESNRSSHREFFLKKLSQ